MSDLKYPYDLIRFRILQKERERENLSQLWKQFSMARVFTAFLVQFQTSTPRFAIKHNFTKINNVEYILRDFISVKPFTAII